MCIDIQSQLIVDRLCHKKPHDFLSTGYVYMSMEKEYMLNVDLPYYRPDIGNEIWNGFISIDPVTPSGPVWEEFAQRVIEEYQDPIWTTQYCHLIRQQAVSRFMQVIR